MEKSKRFEVILAGKGWMGNDIYKKVTLRSLDGEIKDGDFSEITHVELLEVITVSSSDTAILEKRVFGGESFETLNAALIKDENLDLEDIIDFVGDYR